MPDVPFGQQLRQAPSPQPLRLAPEPDESASGFVLRVAARNLCSGNEMAEWLGLPKLGDQLDGDPRPSARLLGIEPEAFAQMGFEDDSSGWVLGHRVPTNRLHRNARLNCPDCLAEAPYHRRIWSLRQLDVCPRHGRALIHRCPECDSVLVWGGQAAIQHCYCGAPLNVRGCSAAVEDSTGASVAYLHCGLPAPGDRLPPVFADLPLAVLLDLLIFLGRMEIIIVQGNPDGLVPREMLTDRRILNTGAQIALGWPDAFDALAYRVRAAYPNKIGLAGQYGYLYRYIKRASATPSREILSSAFMAHLIKRGDISSSMLPSFLELPPSAAERLVTVTEIRDMFAIGHKAYLTLRDGRVWSERLKAVATSRRGVPLYRLSDVEALGNRLNQFISFRQADLMFGFSQDKTRELIAAGVLRQSPDVMRNKIGRASIEREQVQGIIDTIRRDATAPAPVVPLGFQALHRAAVMRPTVGFPVLLRGLLAQQLRGHIAFPEQSDLNAIVFETTEANEFLDRLGSSARSGKMQLSEVARKMKLSPKAVRELTALGLLGEPETKGSAVLFDPGAVQDFWDRFTYDAALGHTYGMRAVMVRVKLARRGIQPIATLNTHKGQIAAVYRKSDVGDLPWPRVPNG